MDDSTLQVYFCDLCNTSVPEADLASGKARKVGAHVVGDCCLSQLVPAPAGGQAPAGGVTQHGVAVLLLAAVAGAAVFLDWRLSDEMAEGRHAVARGEQDLRAQGERLQQIEKRLDGGAMQGDVVEVQRRLQEMQETISSVQQSLPAKAKEDREGVARLEDLMRALQDSQQAVGQRLAALDAELLRIAADVSHLRANPPVAAPVRQHEEWEVPVPMPAVVDAPASPELAPGLAHQIQRLRDPDAGVRFEAVDKLAQSGDENVRPALLGMIKDEDPFVRRLTVDGLAAFRHPDTVDALIEALGDRESIVRLAAYVSLKALTQQRFSFDPDGSREDRLAGQRRWQDWWKTARVKF